MLVPYNHTSAFFFWLLEESASLKFRRIDDLLQTPLTYYDENALAAIFEIET